MSNLTTRATKGDSLTHGELDTNFKRGAQTKAASYTVVEGDNRDAIDVTAVATITLPDATAIVAAADTGDFEVTLNNTTVAVMTITCVTGTDTIDGSTSDYIVNGIDSITLKVDQAGTGYNIVGGAATKTATEEWSNKTLISPIINGSATGTAIGRGCLVYKSAAETITGSTYTHLSFDLEEYDTDSIHDNVTNNKRLTVPTGVTKIRLTAQALWAAGTSGTRAVYISKNDETTTPTVVNGLPSLIEISAADKPENVTSALIDVVAGDYFTLCVWFNGPATLDIDASGGFGMSTWFAMEIIK